MLPFLSVPLFSLTLFLSAALAFVVQPLIAKRLLPLLGGSPAVWNTCLVFFQATLLVGYAVSDRMVRLKPRTQVVAHLALLTAAAGAAAYGWWTPLGEPAVDSSPTGWLLAALATTVGMPFLVLSVNSTLLQRWFASSGAAQDPYSLYRASNLGSLLGLLAFPFVFEPWLPLSAQAGVWIAGFVALVLMVAACGRHVWRRARFNSGRRGKRHRTGDMAAARAVGGRGICAVEPHDWRDDVHQHGSGGGAAVVGDSAVALPVIVCDHVRPEPATRLVTAASWAFPVLAIAALAVADRRHAADTRQPPLAPSSSCSSLECWRMAFWRRTGRILRGSPNSTCGSL